MSENRTCKSCHKFSDKIIKKFGKLCAGCPKAERRKLVLYDVKENRFNKVFENCGFERRQKCE